MGKIMISTWIKLEQGILDALLISMTVTNVKSLKLLRGLKMTTLKLQKSIERGNKRIAMLFLLEIKWLLFLMIPIIKNYLSTRLLTITKHAIMLKKVIRIVIRIVRSSLMLRKLVRATFRHRKHVKRVLGFKLKQIHHQPHHRHPIRIDHTIQTLLDFLHGACFYFCK